MNVLSIKSKMARSRSLGLLSKSTSRFKHAVLPTRELWKGIHFTKDVQPSQSEEEHLLRVFNKEGTPYIASKSALSARFRPVKDKFIEKYEPLLKEFERRNYIDEIAKKSRDYL